MQIELWKAPQTLKKQWSRGNLPPSIGSPVKSTQRLQVTVLKVSKNWSADSLWEKPLTQVIQDYIMESPESRLWWAEMQKLARRQTPRRNGKLVPASKQVGSREKLWMPRLRAWAVGWNLPYPLLTPFLTFGKLHPFCKLQFLHLYNVDIKPTSLGWLKEVMLIKQLAQRMVPDYPIIHINYLHHWYW